ncbi:MFS transporter [Candidatus Bathyarchaeota archaeon]|nr:MFS transporter [Candidatus Bathyarchaeota archaeon]
MSHSWIVILVKKEFPTLQPLWLAVFADVLGFTLIVPLLKQIEIDFNATEIEVALVLSLNALFGFFFGPIFGKVSDKHGRKPLLLVAQAGTMGSFLMFAFSNSLFMIYLSRILDGCFGGNFPIAKAIISDIVPPKDRSVQMTNVGVAHNLANVIGPSMSGFLYTWSGGIIGPGLLGTVLSLFTIILTALKLEETAPSKTGKTVFGDLSKIEAAGNGIIPERKIRKNETAMILLFQWGTHTLSFFIFMSSLSLFAGERLGLSPQDIGLLLMVTGLFQLFVRYVLFYPMLKRFGERRMATLGLAIFPVVFFLTGFVTVEWQLVLILLGMSFSASSVRGVLTGFLSRSVDPRDQGKIQGLNTSLDTLAQIIGPLLSGMTLMFLPIMAYGILPALVAIIPLLVMLKPLEFSHEKMLMDSRDEEAPDDEMSSNKLMADS